jgi:hypothetical protein
MRAMLRLLVLALAAAAIVPLAVLAAPPDRTMAVLEGLAPFSLLLSTPQGREALAANQRVTWDVQRGGSGRADGTLQPLLLPFPQEQAQALKDAFITSKNASGLADGLGSGLARAYWSLARYESHDDGATITTTGNLPAVEDLLSHAVSVIGAGSAAAKYLFGDGDASALSIKCKFTPVAGADAIVARPGAAVDIYGQAYGLPSNGTNSTLGADPCGNSRPFQTDYRLITYAGKDFWGERSGNALYLDGPAQDLRANPAFPSGHTAYGYTESVLLGILVPARYAQMVTRAAEYGNNRIILGAHYAMDVVGGRTLALYGLAHLLADDRGAVVKARSELTDALDRACRATGAAACSADAGRFKDPAADAAFYDSTQTYGLPVVNANSASGVEDVSALSPDAGYLLTAAFPKLSLKQADDILTATEGPGGGFLDTGGEFGLYSRIDLYKAVVAAAQ